MARVFISYARADAARAEALARALERAGHLVWWDRHIQSGSRFAQDIDQELKAADAVIVLWSGASVKSAWVQDEAAEGRDSNRLVPVVIDGCKPPLGFRQYQSIDMSQWTGRRKLPDQLLRAVSALEDGSPAEMAAGQSTGPRLESRPWPRRMVAAAIVVFLAIGVLFGSWRYLASERRSSDETPTLAVLPFADLSPGRDKAYLAEGVAEAILTGLAKEGGIRVIGRSTSQQLQNAGSDAERIRRALGVTHVLEGSARSAGNDLRMSVRLIAAADGQQLWAEEYQRRLDNVFAVQDEIGRAVAQRLKGSFSPAAKPAPLTNADVYTLYLAARAKVRDRRMSSLQDALKIARQVIAIDPEYAPGHALYAELMGHLSFDAYGNIPSARARQLGEPHAREAIRLAPEQPEGYAALGMILFNAEAIKPLSTAIRLDPARAELRLWLAHALNGVARQEDAYKHVVAATEIDPLFTPAVWTQAYMLSASGRMKEAEAAVDRFESRGGSQASAAMIRANILASGLGDYSGAVRLLQFALAKDPETPIAGQSLAWLYRTLGFPQRSADAGKTLPMYTRLLLANDLNQLRSLVLRDRAAIWQRPDPEAAVEGLALTRDWGTLENLHDQSDEPLRTVCGDARSWLVQEGIHFATALAAKNRVGDAKRYLNCVKPLLTAQARGPFRSMFLSQPQIEWFWAQIHAIEGEPRPAFERLDRAVRGGIRTRYSAGMSDFPAFDRYRDAAEYGAMDARLKRLIATERAQVLQADQPKKLRLS